MTKSSNKPCRDAVRPCNRFPSRVSMYFHVFLESDLEEGIFSNIMAPFHEYRIRTGALHCLQRETVVCELRWLVWRLCQHVT